MTLLMLARRAREQEAVFRRRGLGEPFGIQLAGKRLGIVGMGNIGTPPHTWTSLVFCFVTHPMPCIAESTPEHTSPRKRGPHHLDAGNCFHFVRLQL